MRCLRLQPFERHHLPLVEPWFLGAETRRWLGGPAWPRLMLDRAGRPLADFGDRTVRLPVSDTSATAV